MGINKEASHMQCSRCTLWKVTLSLGKLATLHSCTRHLLQVKLSPQADFASCFVLVSQQIKAVCKLGLGTAGWAQPGHSHGHQASHAAVPYCGLSTGIGEHYTGHNDRHVGGFNQHDGVLAIRCRHYQAED